MPLFPSFRFLLFLGTPLSIALGAETSESLNTIKALREQRDQTVWQEEKMAQQYETAFIDLWDKLRACGNLFQPLRDFPLETIEQPNFGKPETLLEGVTLRTHQTTPSGDWSRSQYLELLTKLETEGYKIDQSEWHHTHFKPPSEFPARSEFSFSIHVKGPSPKQQRYILKGVLDVRWNATPGLSGVFTPNDIRFNSLQAITRPQAPPFEESLWLESKSRTTPYSIVLVEDLNGDGLSDIIFPKNNTVHYNQGDFTFRETMLATFPIRGQTTAAILVDLDLDGKIEYVTASYEAPYLFAYTYNPNTETFDGKPFGIWKSEKPLIIQLLAAGDLTGDGYPELYLGPSTPAYEGGNMPTPYFDANDGKPAYLLQNTGGLGYTDITDRTALAAKRGRRAYVASMIDLNDDRRADLVVTSDFSGIDVYENTTNSLVDRTDDWIDDRSLFGMSQSFADFDRDGNLDLLAVGMSSTTARRLEQMGLGRSEFPEHQAMRMQIAYGNRLYYGNGKGEFSQRPISQQTARSGWSWGSSSFDFNNDSYPDMFISNGYLSKGTARDYCTNFWTHDIYQEKSISTSQISEYFDILGPKALVGGNKMGWNPFEKDHLFLNLKGEGFVNVAYLFGVSNGGDGRAVIGEDFDRDGRVDILLVEQDSLNASERVFIYKNKMPEDRNWIGFDISRSKGKPVIGTRIRLVAPDFETERVYTLGEAYSGQAPSNFHFGLGASDKIEQVKVLWPDGSETILIEPEVNRYHSISP